MLGAALLMGAVLAAAYMLRLLKQIIWGREDQGVIRDMNVREVVYLLPLILFVLWVGFFPRPYVHVMEKTLMHLFNQLQAILH